MGKIRIHRENSIWEGFKMIFNVIFVIICLPIIIILIINWLLNKDEWIKKDKTWVDSENQSEG